MKAIVFGSLNMDLSINCERIPAAGETIDGSDFITNPGGKGANQAVAAARMGAPTYMIGAVGKDDFGSVLVGCLEGSGIDVTYVQELDDVASGTATIIRMDGDNRIILGHGANYAMTVEDVDKAIDAIAEPGDIFLAQFECLDEVTEAALKHAHEKGCFTMVNPAPAREIPESLWPALDYLCMNETECETITGDYPFGVEDAAQAAHKIAAKGVQQVVITLGEHGAYGLDGDAEYFVPARKVKAVDTTAAGDTFIGAMVAAHDMGMDFETAMKLATAASSLTVQRIGAQQSIPSLREVEELGY